MISLACGHADRRQRDAQHGDTGWLGSGPLAQGYSAEMHNEGWPWQQLQGTRGLSQIRRRAFAMWVPVYNMNTNVHVHRHVHKYNTQVFTCIHTPTKTHAHSYMHQRLFTIGAPGGGVISSNCSGAHDF